MRIAFLLIVLALAACGKKKAPQSPGATESKEMKQDADEKDMNAPAEGEDAKDTRSSDPQEGGE